MIETSEYAPPKVWSWNKPSGGRFENINRPIAGTTHEKELPVGRHPLQLYSQGTPNGVKVTVMLEELPRARPSRRGIRRLADPDRRGRAVRQRLCRGQPEFQDPGIGGPQRPEADPDFRDRRDPGAPRREVRRAPADRGRPSAPNACPGCSGRWAARPMSAAASATSTPTRRSRSNTRSTASRWRQSASSTCSTAGWRRASMSRAPTIRSPTSRSGRGMAGSSSSGNMGRRSSCSAGIQECAALGGHALERPAVKRGRMVNRTAGEPSSQLHERHDAGDFDTKTQDKLAAQS